MKRLAKALLAVILVMSIITAAQAAMLWYFSDSGHIAAAADLIAVFPGGAARVATGVALASKGVSFNLLIAGGGPGGEVKPASLPARVRLLDAGPSRNTFEDALGTRRRILENGFKRVILVTSDYHMLRSWVLLKLLLLGSGVELQRVAVPSVGVASPLGGPRQIAAEMVKLWGNLGELGFYAATGIRLADWPPAERLRRFLKTGTDTYFPPRTSSPPS